MSDLRQIRIRRLRLGPGQWLRRPLNETVQTENEDRAYGLITANVVLIIIVLACFLLHLQPSSSVTLSGCPFANLYCSHITSSLYLPAPKASVLHTFLVFDGAALFIYLGMGFAPERLGTRMMRIFRRDRQKIANRASDRKGFIIPLWVVGLPNAYAIWYLAHETGGPSTSPYAAVLIALLIIAQQAKEVEEIDHETLWSAARASTREYRSFIFVAAAFYLTLWITQKTSPVRAPTASPIFSVGIAIILLFVSTVANYVVASSPRPVAQDS